MVQEENLEIKEEIEEIHRLRKYGGGEARPLKVKFKSQETAQDILSKAWKLANKEMWLRKDMTEEERDRFNVHLSRKLWQ